MTSRLIFVTQRVDPDDPVLGATVAKIAALARALRRGRRAHRQRRPGSAARQLPRAHLRRAHEGRPRPAVRPRARRRARAPSPAGRRPRAHVPDLRGARRSAGAPARRPGAALVRAVAPDEDARRSRRALSTAVVSVDRRTSRSSRREGRRDRARDRHVRSSPAAPARRPGRRSRLSRSAATAASKGLADDRPRRRGSRAAAGVDVRLRCHGTVDRDERRQTRASLARLVAELGLDEAVDARRADPAQRGAGAPRRLVRRSSTTRRSGAPDKVVYEACASCRAGARLEPAATAARRRPRARRCASPTDDAEQLAAGARRARRSSIPPTRAAIGQTPAGAGARQRTRSTRGPTRSCGSRTVSRRAPRRRPPSVRVAIRSTENSSRARSRPASPNAARRPGSSSSARGRRGEPLDVVGGHEVARSRRRRRSPGSS